MKKRRKNSTTKLIWVIVIAIFGILVKNQDVQQFTHGLVNSSKPVSHQVQSVDDRKLSQLTFKSGDPAYIYVNHNQSDLNAKNWQKNQIVYGDLDQLNRTTQATGYLSRVNLVKSSTRTSQTWNPTGWHQKRLYLDGHEVEIQNRGHLLAYSVTGKFNDDGKYDPNALGSLDNPKNLATQTAFSNQRTMQIFEEKVRNALAQDKRVIYQVSTVFKGEDLMPIGYHVQALSTDESLNFNVFVWNVQPGVKFDYATGRSKVDHSMTVQENEAA